MENEKGDGKGKSGLYLGKGLPDQDAIDKSLEEYHDMDQSIIAHLAKREYDCFKRELELLKAEKEYLDKVDETEAIIRRVNNKAELNDQRICKKQKEQDELQKKINNKELLVDQKVKGLAHLMDHALFNELLARREKPAPTFQLNQFVYCGSCGGQFRYEVANYPNHNCKKCGVESKITKVAEVI